MKNKSEGKIKDAIKERYAKAITKGTSCCGQESQKTGCGAGALTMAGYRKEELGKIPSQAQEASMGCGNPLSMAQVLPGQTVLDLGSGAGLDCFIAAEKVGPQGKVYGLDMTPQMIARAEENAREGGFTNVEFLLGELENIPLPDNSVDWVISNCVVNLSPDKPQAFKEIARVLRPGGRISISDIVVEDFPEEMRQRMEVWAACVGGAISEEEYVQGLAAAGLQEVKVTSRYTYSLQEMETIMVDEIKHYSLSPEAASLGKNLLNKMAGKISSARFEGVKK